MSPQLVSILAQISACNARVAAMQAENAHRVSNGWANTYGEDAFNQEAAGLEYLAAAARECT